VPLGGEGGEGENRIANGGRGATGGEGGEGENKVLVYLVYTLVSLFYNFNDTSL